MGEGAIGLVCDVFMTYIADVMHMWIRLCCIISVTMHVYYGFDTIRILICTMNGGTIDMHSYSGMDIRSL